MHMREACLVRCVDILLGRFSLLGSDGKTLCSWIAIHVWCSSRAEVPGLGDLLPRISSSTQEARCSLVPKRAEGSAVSAEQDRFKLVTYATCTLQALLCLGLASCFEVASHST